jgi:hypothetical protein
MLSETKPHSKNLRSNICFSLSVFLFSLSFQLMSKIYISMVGFREFFQPVRLPSFHHDCFSAFSHLCSRILLSQKYLVHLPLQRKRPLPYQRLNRQATALIAAAAKGHHEVVRRLVTNKPPASADKAIRGQEVTALMLAVSQVVGVLEYFSLLILPTRKHDFLTS